MTSELWQRIQRGRKHAALTQDVVAKTCGTSRNAISLWESEDPTNRATPTVQNLSKMAKCFAVETGSEHSTVAGWLLDDASDLKAGWKQPAQTAVIAEPTAPYSRDEIPKRAAKMIANFARLNPVLQDHITGIVAALALPADPGYQQWEEEQRRKNHARDSRAGKLGLMSDDAGDADPNRHSSDPRKPTARRAKKK